MVPVTIKDPLLGEFSALNILAEGKPLVAQNPLFSGKKISVYLGHALPEMIRPFDCIVIVQDQDRDITQLRYSRLRESLPYTLIRRQGPIIFI